jgi:tyrosinase
MPGSMVYRLPVAEPVMPHMATFRESMTAAQAIVDNRGYNYIAGFHGAPGQYCWHHQISRRTPVQARLFLPWHRAYLWWLEQALQDLVPGAALPYWDWTTDPQIPSAYASAEIDGQPNPLAATKMYVPTAEPPLDRMTGRAPGTTPGSRLPTAAEISDLLNDSDWASFSDRLEDFHDHVHVWVGGDMQDINTAAFDPIFFAHHCQIDRLWYLWQVRHGNGSFPAELLGEPLTPFGKTPGDVLNAQALGYEYAASAAAVPATGASQ